MVDEINTNIGDDKIDDMALFPGFSMPLHFSINYKIMLAISRNRKFPE